MTNRYAVIGGIAAGMSAASRIRKVDPESEIAVFEKGEYISYSACSMPYYISNPEGDYKDLIVLTVDDARNKRGIDVRTKHLVLGISPNEKRVFYKELISGKEKSIDYHKLIIATGASPVKPPIAGVDNENVFSLRTLDDGIKIKNFIAEKKPKKAVIVGAGYIGLEMCESFKESGLEVTVVEMLDEILIEVEPVSKMALVERLGKAGVEIYTGWHLEEVTDKGVVCTDKKWGRHKIEADTVVLAVGLKARKELAEKFRGLAPEVYVIGDCVEARKIYHAFEDAWRAVLAT